MLGDVKEIDKPLSLSRRHSFSSSHNPPKQIKQETRDKALRKYALNLGHTPFLISESLNTINPLLSRLSQRSPPPPYHPSHLRGRKFGSIKVSVKLPTYPSSKLTLTLTSRLGQNHGLGEG